MNSNTPPPTADELKNLYNFLFWKDDQKQDTAQVSIMIWKEKESKFGKGRVGFYLPPTLVGLQTKVPNLIKAFATKVDLEITVLCNGVQTIPIRELTLSETPPIINELFTIAISQASGEIQEDVGDIVGYVQKQFKNEDEPNYYRVTQTGEYHTVHKGFEKNNRISWKEWDLNSPKTKSVIKQFKEEFANGSLQTISPNV
ncbi:hypothetical protein [Aureispira sp. CCB-QB1]|uniref:hypothetical protein n=1 Tax=Aureispira sp. CCB-QB1 TaxID=1313421 RepID=UPI00069814AF|nr:hypothetical protein [Aureispira sp. CCB-QB1]